MSLQIQTKIICDQCGETISGPIITRSQDAKSSYWLTKRVAQSKHWLFLQRYGTTRHLCATCADSAPKPATNTP